MKRLHTVIEHGGKVYKSQLVDDCEGVCNLCDLKEECFKDKGHVLSNQCDTLISSYENWKVNH